MALFVRPAVWTYDQELFRWATDDEERLESMLAAIALEDQGLWVVESNQRPVAFAWTQIERDTVRLVKLYVAAGAVPAEALRLLIARIEQEYIGEVSRLEVAPSSLSGAGPDTLREVGLTCEGEVWSKQLWPRRLWPRE